MLHLRTSSNQTLKQDTKDFIKMALWWQGSRWEIGEGFPR